MTDDRRLLFFSPLFDIVSQPKGFFRGGDMGNGVGMGLINRGRHGSGNVYIS